MPIRSRPHNQDSWRALQGSYVTGRSLGQPRAGPNVGRRAGFSGELAVAFGGNEETVTRMGVKEIGSQVEEERYVFSSAFLSFDFFLCDVKL